MILRQARKLDGKSPLPDMKKRNCIITKMINAIPQHRVP
jgi:hypothetical protein